MSATFEPSLLSKIRSLTPEQAAEVESFVDALMEDTCRHSALQRLLSIAPALERAGATLSDTELAEELAAARRQRASSPPSVVRKDMGADPS